MKETTYTTISKTLQIAPIVEISTCQYCGDQDEFLMVLDKGKKINIWLCSSCFLHLDRNRS